MRKLAIIPARGGSKRIIRKNIKEFLGKPIIAYSIETALASNLFDEVMVSTDDEEIAKIATKYGAIVPFMRSPEAANDFATTWDVIDEVVFDYSQKLAKNFECVCCIYPTAPLIKTNDLDKGLQMLINEEYDTVFPVIAFSYPIWRCFEIAEKGETKMVWPEHMNSRSQDLKTVYHDAGQWYWINIERQNKALFTQNTGSVVLNDYEVQDIDTLNDWKIAEMKYKLIHE